MKKRTKLCVFTALCVLVLSMGLLTGCGSGDKDKEEISGSAIENQVGSEAEDLEENKVENEVPDKEADTTDDNSENDNGTNPDDTAKDDAAESDDAKSDTENPDTVEGNSSDSSNESKQ